MYFDKNLEALKTKYYNVYEIIKENKFECNASLVENDFSKAGEAINIYNLNGKKIYLNSRYDSKYEAKMRMKQYEDMADESVLFMFGFANGSFVREFLNITNETITCVVYEPCIEVFLSIIASADISDIIMSNRVSLCVLGLNGDDFNSMVSGKIQIFNKDNNRNMAPPRYLELFNDEYLVFKKTMIDRYEQFYIVTNTAISYGKFTVRNDIMNMKYLKGCRSGHDLSGKFPNDMAAIVVAAGPSLKKNLHLLEKAKGKALIIVVDTAINKVLEIGVKPDMISAIDFSKPVEMFTAPGVRDIPMLTGMDFNVEVLEYLNPKNLYFCESDSIVWDKMFKDEGSEILNVNDGGSVATFSMAMIISWGIKRIIMIGQDLAMTGNKEHFGDENDIGDIDMDRYTYVPGVEEDKVLVRKDFYMYLKWIEDAARIFKDIDFIDATEGGSLKANTRQMKFSEAIELYCTKEYDIKGIIEAPKRLFEDDNRIITYLDGMKRELKNLKRQLTEGALECRRAKKEFETGSNDVKLLKRAARTKRKLDDLLFNSDLYSYINKYVTDVEIVMLKDLFDNEQDDTKEAMRMFEKTANYYDGVAKGIPDIIGFVDECIDSINN